MAISLSRIICPFFRETTVSLSVSGEVTGGLYNYVDNHIVPELEKLSGVASVSSYGGQQEYISITLQRDQMEQYFQQPLYPLGYLLGSSRLLLGNADIDCFLTVIAAQK